MKPHLDPEIRFHAGIVENFSPSVFMIPDRKIDFESMDGYGSGVT